MLPIESFTSALKFKFAISLLLLNCAFCTQNQEIGNNTIPHETDSTIVMKNENNTIINNETDSEIPTTIIVPATTIREEPIKSGSEIQDSRSKDPAPVYETEKSVFENPAQDFDHSSNVAHKIQTESDGFKPNTYLGRIEEINFTGTIGNPFLKAQSVGSENVNPEPSLENQLSVKQKMVKFYDADYGYKPESGKIQSVQYLPEQQGLRANQNQFPDSEYMQRALGHETKVIHGILSIKPATQEKETFHVENVEVPYHGVNTEKSQYYANADSQFSQVDLHKPYFLESTERPYHQFGLENSVKFPGGEKFTQGYVQNYGHSGNFPAFTEQLPKPDFEFEQQFKKPEYVDHFKKPESLDGLNSGLFGAWNHFKQPEHVVYGISHEIAHMRTKKFPFHFHQSMFVTELPTLVEIPAPEFVLERNRVSPWKKILHLLGAAIPIGLLLAVLTPSQLIIPNNITTVPNIILPSLKLDNSPVEHRAARISHNRDTCEERSICKTILEGANDKSNLMQTALWNLSKRITDEIAKKNGLQEIFAAAKRKDCGSLTC